ncbi:hypothetical protein HG537_0H00940 [Torulaspora globosa]|uniref:Hyaluronan/mRNA-binding protein domain-containing protein n=1 Tax=Torulaspora globosa TaxID=48254 RepID=A0A7H9HY84_9SACH|nr:hypothetical protein HG537_0H00940 [Torulaspora sp. CBS 2947]
MSTPANPFDLLGNDVEDADVVISPPKEIVKKNTSSKKADVPPPSANPARANKNRPRPTGNDAALKDKTAGRQNNRSKDVPESSKTKKTNPRKSTDRHSRTGKVDTQKKVNQGWGDDKKELSAEAEGELDAQAEAEADNEAEAAAGIAKMSLQDYLQEKSADTLNKTPGVKKVEALNDAELFKKETEVLAEATKVKNIKSKPQKTKEFLDFDATFVESNPRPRRDFDNKNRRGGRGGRAARGGRNNANPVHTNGSIDTKNLPTLS